VYIERLGWSYIRYNIKIYPGDFKEILYIRRYVITGNVVYGLFNMDNIGDDAGERKIVRYSR